MSAWIVSPNHIAHIVDGAIDLGIIPQEDAQKVGRTLTRANVKSIRAHYGSYDEGANAVKPFVYRKPRVSLTFVSLLKQVKCYDYQTSEFDGYPQSPAGRLIAKIARSLAQQGVTRESPGYDEAPWGV